MHYTHTLTDTEVACGVTLDAVAEVLTQALVKGDTYGRVIFPEHTPPALATSAARCAHAGAPVTFLGINQLSQPVYGKADR